MSALAWLAVGIFGPSALVVGLAVLVESLRRPTQPRTPPPPRVPPTVVLGPVKRLPDGELIRYVWETSAWSGGPSLLSAVDRMAMAEQYDEIRALPETAER